MAWRSGYPKPTEGTHPLDPRQDSLILDTSEQLDGFGVAAKLLGDQPHHEPRRARPNLRHHHRSLVAYLGRGGLFEPPALGLCPPCH